MSNKDTFIADAFEKALKYPMMNRLLSNGKVDDQVFYAVTDALRFRRIVLNNLEVRAYIAEQVAALDGD